MVQLLVLLLTMSVYTILTFSLIARSTLPEEIQNAISSPHENNPYVVGILDCFHNKSTIVSVGYFPMFTLVL